MSKFHEHDVVRVIRDLKGVDTGLREGPAEFIDLNIGMSGVVHCIHWNDETQENYYLVEFTDESGLKTLALPTLPENVLELDWQHVS
jgi:hypothetical protein